MKKIIIVLLAFCGIPEYTINAMYGMHVRPLIAMQNISKEAHDVADSISAEYEGKDVEMDLDNLPDKLKPHRVLMKLVLDVSDYIVDHESLSDELASKILEMPLALEVFLLFLQHNWFDTIAIRLIVHAASLHPKALILFLDQLKVDGKSIIDSATQAPLLHHAAMCTIECVAILIAHGVDINRCDEKSFTALDMACIRRRYCHANEEQKYDNIIALLRKHGAKLAEELIKEGKKIERPRYRPTSSRPWGAMVMVDVD